MAQIDTPPTKRRWSWSAGKLAGIDVRIHATFLLLIAWIVLTHLLSGHGVRATLGGVAFVGVVFVVVVLHELGHALVARRFGIGTHDITLLPIGGVARLERIPTKPKEELLVAIAGPMVNFVLAAITFGVILVAGASWAPNFALVGGPFLAKFFWLNIGLGVFNLLPAFPMDGGRVLRASIALFASRLRATQIASRVGQFVAAGFGVIGFFTGQPMLFFIALFVWFGAREEARAVRTAALFESVRVADAMVTRFECLPADSPIGFAAERAVHGLQAEFPVLDHDILIGFVNADSLVAIARETPDATVRSIVRPVAEVADPAEPVNEAMKRMGPLESVLPVFSLGRFVGLLLPENVMSVATLHRAHAT